MDFYHVHYLCTNRYVLIKDTPESKQETNGKFKFDYLGLAIFAVTMVALNVVINFGADLGWTSPLNLGLAVVTIVGLIAFIKVEKSKDVVLIDFSVFKNKPYTGATVF